jgi:hypothetical protein
MPPITEEMYLDYINNFLTVSKFAAYYGLDESEARAALGDYYHHAEASGGGG